MEDKEKEVLKVLELDVTNFKKELKEVVDTIVNEGFSKFPMLIAHKEDIALAQKVLDKELFNSSFSFSASTLEELVSKGVILKEKEEAFKEQIETNKDKNCVLLIHPEVMKFIFTSLK
ncbi:MAG: hypothetical protein KJP21_02580 [Bacteroidia bacterium]|nr:hypothetical protein [Bacteroidia bacterium]NNJ54956.1 hypothetical protein [Bacteroidia bacterium]